MEERFHLRSLVCSYCCRYSVTAFFNFYGGKGAGKSSEGVVAPVGSSACHVLQGDSRAPSSMLQWPITADAEALAWNPFEPTQFLVSSEDGIVAAFDARAGAESKPMYRLSAHDKPTCSLSFSSAVRGLLATASTDKQASTSLTRSEPDRTFAASHPCDGAAFMRAIACLLTHDLRQGRTAIKEGEVLSIWLSTFTICSITHCRN